VAVVPEGGLVIAPDGLSAELNLKGLGVIDQPRWPAYDAEATPARMSLRVTWKALKEEVIYEDPQKHFKFTGHKALAQAAAEVAVPSIGFSWQSDPIETSRAAFAIIGTEVNGRYYDKT
jgi:hypothetical protein